MIQDARKGKFRFLSIIDQDGLRQFACLQCAIMMGYGWLTETMSSLQEKYDDAMFDFSQGQYDAAISRLKEILKTDPNHFDAQLALGMAHYRKGEFDQAIAEGHKAELLNPREQLVHTNLSLFYMKAGDKQKAEHHGLQARISSWRTDNKEGPAAPADPELQLAKPAGPKPPESFPDMPWKKKPTS